MSIFLNDAYYHDPFSQLSYSSRDRRTYSPNWASAFETSLTSRMNQMAHASQMKTMDLTSNFEDMNLRDVTEGKRKERMEEAEQTSMDALQSIQTAQTKGSPIRSLSQLVKTRQQKLQKLQSARKSLEKAQDLYDVSGSGFKYTSTGYNPFTPEASMFEEQFDQAIETRKQQYAELHGYDSFEDVPEGYAMQSYYQGNDQAGAGQRDILDMIMRDITGVQYRDLVNLNTYAAGADPGFDWGNYTPENYTGDQLEVLKDFFVTSSLSAYESANKRAEAEDLFRKKSAEAAQQQTLRGQKTLKKSSEESLGKSLEDVQLQIRELDTDFMKKLGAFQTTPRKKKVRSVTFGEDRPQ